MLAFVPDGWLARPFVRTGIGAALTLVVAACGTPAENSSPSSTPMGRVRLTVPGGQQIEATPVRWRSGLTGTVIIEESGGDDSPRARVLSPGHPDFTITAPGGFIRLIGEKRGDALPASLLKRNVASGAYLFEPADLKTADATAVVALIGHAYASDPPGLRLLTVNASGQPYELFSSDAFELSDVVDVDGDRHAEVIGKHTLAEQWGRCFESYAPFAVYQLPPSGLGVATRSLELSRKYNRDHYYGWVGPESSDDWVVVLCAPEQPAIMRRADAERRFEPVAATRGSRKLARP